MPVALYREYRPRTFAELVGQEHVSRTLLNAIGQSRLAHAYLFTGPRGTGKTSMARILAKALNCPNTVDGQPCGVCPTCETIASGDGVDVLELDAASNRGIEEIRTLRERIRLAPVGGRYKVYVIDEVHMLTNEAFNALLKTLEEPPANVVFVLCTTEAYRVPATILSRCQRFDFHRHSTEAIAAHLATVCGEIGRTVSPAALRAIARAATGSMRDGLSILDQCLAYTQGNVEVADTREILGAVDAGRLAQLTGAILAGDVGGTWRELDGLLEQGRDPREMARILGHHFRDLLLYRLAGPAGEATGPLADDPQLLATQAGIAGERFLYEAIDTLASGEAEIRLASQPRLVLEARLVRLCASQSPDPAGKRAAAVLPAGARAAEPLAPQPAAVQAPGPAPAPRDARDDVPLPEAPPADEDDVSERRQPARQAPTRTPRQSTSPAPTASSRHDGGAADEVRIPPVPPAESSPNRAEAVSPTQLARAWQGALAQLTDIEAGYLAAAVPECQGKAIVVWLGEGMDWLGDYLANKGTCRKLSGLLAGVIGAELPVSVKVRPQRGLFEAPGNGGVAVPAAEPAGSPQDDADLREAQLMFGAEEVAKGVYDQ